VTFSQSADRSEFARFRRQPVRYVLKQISQIEVSSSARLTSFPSFHEERSAYVYIYMGSLEKLIVFFNSRLHVRFDVSICQRPLTNIERSPFSALRSTLLIPDDSTSSRKVGENKMHFRSPLLPFPRKGAERRIAESSESFENSSALNFKPVIQRLYPTRFLPRKRTYFRRIHGTSDCNEKLINSYFIAGAVPLPQNAFSRNEAFHLATSGIDISGDASNVSSILPIRQIRSYRIG